MTSTSTSTETSTGTGTGTGTETSTDTGLGRDAMHSLSPHLVCAGAADAIDFYTRAFGATELVRMPGPDGKLMHACVLINGSSVMLVDENPDWDVRGPHTLGGSPVTIHLIVPDVDEYVARAVAAGAEVVMPVEDAFWGDRYGVIVDPFGHSWSVATPQREVGKEEIEAALEAMKATGET